MTEEPSAEDQTLLSHYNRQTQDGTLRMDAGQWAVLEALDRLRAQLQRPAPARRPLRFRSADSPQPTTDGIYIWGDVGRGKTMLMDLFFRQTDKVEKRRFHFDAFMRDLHAGIHRAHSEGHGDPLAGAVSMMAGGVRLLALDELQVRDTADSTILRRVFGLLFAAGVTVVSTSNTPLTALYGTGAKREVFQPLIDLLSKHLAVHHLDGGVDFRRQTKVAPNNYFFPNDPHARAELDRIWDDLTGHQARPVTLRIHGRDFVLPAFHDGMARISFAQACSQPRSAADYLALCGGLRILILDDVPRLSIKKHDVARRFIMLVDALYDAKVRLIISAEVEADLLYPEGEGVLSFQRAVSRLSEMQGWT